MSTPNLASRAISPPLLIASNSKRASQQGNLPPTSSVTQQRKASDSTTPTRPGAYTSRRSFDVDRDRERDAGTTSPPPPPKSPLRSGQGHPNNLARASFASSSTQHSEVASSLLENNRSSTQFGTVRTATTNATSLHSTPHYSPLGDSFYNKRDSDDFRFGLQQAADSQEASGTTSPSAYQTPLTDLPTTSRRQSFDRERALAKLSATPSQVDLLMVNRRRERKSSLDFGGGPREADLSNVEEVDEGTRRGRPGGFSSSNSNSRTPTSIAATLDNYTNKPYAFDSSSSNSDSPSQPSVLRPSPIKRPSLGPVRRPSVDLRPGQNNLQLGKGVRPDDFMAAAERHRSMNGERGEKDVFGSTAPVAVPTSSPAGRLRNTSTTEIDLSITPPTSAGLPRRPSYRPSHGHRHSVDTIMQQPVAPQWPSRDGREKGREGREGSPPSSRDSSTPSPSGGNGAAPVPPRMRRGSSARAMYVPKTPLEGPYSNGYIDNTSSSSAAATPISPSSARVPFPRSLSGETSNSRLASLETLTQAGMPRYRGRYNSEMDLPKRKSRPISLDDGGNKIARSRYESMISLGTPSDLLSNKDSSFIEVVTVRTEGKADRTYVRCFFPPSFSS